MARGQSEARVFNFAIRGSGSRSRPRAGLPGTGPGGRVEPLPAPGRDAVGRTERSADDMPEHDDDEFETAETPPEDGSRTGEEQAASNREDDPPA